MASFSLSRPTLRHVLPTVARVMLALLCLVGVARADQAVSPWSDSVKSSVRLVSGGRGQDGSFRVGVEIRLAPGFKTYWRAPGDSGIPPTFDWGGSENVGAVSVRWPVPRRHVDNDVVTIGYKGSVIYPVSVRPADPAKPVVVSLKLDYAVCEAICIPATGSVRLQLVDVPATDHTERLQRFRDQVPRAVEPGKADGRLSLASVTASLSNGSAAVNLFVGVPANGGVEDVFLEGPDGWVFGTPERIEPAAGAPNGTLQFRLPVLDKPRNSAGLVPFVATLADRSGGVEVRFDLDIMAARP